MAFKATVWAWKQGIDPMDKLTLLALADYADKDTFETRRSLNAIAEKTGAGRRTVMRSLNRLEAAGLIERQKGDRATSTLYRILVTGDGKPGQVGSQRPYPPRVTETLPDTQPRATVTLGPQRPYPEEIPPESENSSSGQELAQEGWCHGDPRATVTLGPEWPPIPKDVVVVNTRARAREECPALPAPQPTSYSAVMNAIGTVGWDMHRVMTGRVVGLARRWASEGATPEDIAHAVEIAKRSRGGELPNSPAYLAPIMRDLLRAKHEPLTEDPSDEASRRAGRGGRPRSAAEATYDYWERLLEPYGAAGT